jgi:hypothetical protein
MARSVRPVALTDRACNYTTKMKMIETNVGYY